MNTAHYTFAFVLLLLTACTSRTTYSKWQTVSGVDDSAPIARHEAAFVAVGDSFYLLGGRGIRPVSIYDTKTERWTEGSKPPIEIHHFQPIVYKEKIYLVGAFTGGWPNEVPVANIIIYDPAADEWSTGPAIPTTRQRGAAGAVLYNDKIYIAGGLQNGHIGGHQPWLDSYDLITGDWAVLPDAPRTRDHFNAVVAEGQLYLVAGRNTTTGDDPFGGTVEEVDVYDIATMEWSTTNDPLPTPRAGNAALLVGSELLVIGGESPVQEAAHNEVEALHVHTHTWRAFSPMLQGRHGTGAILFNKKVYLASGCGKRGGEPELNTMEAMPVKKSQHH